MSRQDIFDDIDLSGKSVRVAAEQSGARTALVSRMRIFGLTKGSRRTKIRKLLFAAVACGVPVVGLAAPAEGTSETTTRVAIPIQYIGGPNPVPGGLTLVPGTVLVPGLSGSAITGTVPVPGTPGAPGVSDLNPAFNIAPYPGVSAAPYPSILGNGSALYPPAYYPQFGSPGTNQSTLPQPGPVAPSIPDVGLFGPSNGYTNSALPPIGDCPANMIFNNGTCGF